MKLRIEWVALTSMVSTAIFLMAGCASSSRLGIASDTEAISRELNERIVDCALAFLSERDLNRARVAYRYRSGSILFDSDNAVLSAHLKQCASPSNGPAGTFEREIEIWSATKE